MKRPPLTRNEKYEIEVRIKYDGYIKKQVSQVRKMKKLENKKLPETVDYNGIGGLRLEARQKLSGDKTVDGRTGEPDIRGITGGYKRTAGISRKRKETESLIFKEKIKGNGEWTTGPPVKRRWI